VYQNKYATDGSIHNYKDHVVAKGLSHVEGIEYSETFAPMAKMDSVFLVLTLVATQGW